MSLYIGVAHTRGGVADLCALGDRTRFLAPGSADAGLRPRPDREKMNLRAIGWSILWMCEGISAWGLRPVGREAGVPWDRNHLGPPETLVEGAT